VNNSLAYDPLLGAGTLTGTGNAEAAGTMLLHDFVPLALAATVGSTLTVSGNVDGSGGFTVIGPGQVVLSGNNTNGIAPVVANGQLVLAHNNAAGSGSIHLGEFPGTNDADLTLQGVTISNNLIVNSGTGSRTLGALGAANYQGDVTLNKDLNLFATLGSILDVSGVIDDMGGNHALNATQVGTVVLSNVNTYGGGTTAFGGTLEVQGNNALGTGDLTLGANTIFSVQNVNILNNVIASPALGGTTGRTISSGGTSSLLGTLDLFNGAGGGDLTVQIAAAPDRLTVSGSVLGNDASIFKTGDGALHLAGNNGWNPGNSAAVHIQGGVLEVHAPTALGVGANAVSRVNIGGTVTSILSLTSNASSTVFQPDVVFQDHASIKVFQVQDNTIDVQWAGHIELNRVTGDAYNTFAVGNSSMLRVQGGLSGPGTLHKTSPGMLVLESSADQLGGAYVEDGILQVDSTMRTGNTTVAGGTLAGGGTLLWDVDGMNSDTIMLLSGLLDVSGLTVDFEVGLGGATESEYLLIDYDAGGMLSLSGNTATDSTFLAALDVPSGYSIVNDQANSRVILQGAPIPEPSTWLLLGVAACGFMARRFHSREGVLETGTEKRQVQRRSRR
ncbi:MAG: PEP-CTERM sorting domain-containing protein, partial [Planctomycetales bacterium]